MQEERTVRSSPKTHDSSKTGEKKIRLVVREEECFRNILRYLIDLQNN